MVQFCGEKNKSVHDAAQEMGDGSYGSFGWQDITGKDGGKIIIPVAS
jgi:hypothetical protein